MSNPLSCETRCCPELETVNIPGTSGLSAFSYTSADFVVPALGANITINALNTEFMAVGEVVFVEGAGWFEVVNIVSATQVELQYLNISQNTSSGNTSSFPALVTPSAEPGIAGTNGGNSYTQTTADFIVPAISGSVAIAVASSDWISIGQNVYVQNAGYFAVTAKADALHFTGTYLDVDGNTNSTNNVVAGATVSPAGPEIASPLGISDGGTGGTTVSTALAALGIAQAATIAYGAGTAYTLTATPALVAMGTTSPTITIPTTGVYKLTARVRVDYVGATFAAVQTLAFKLRRTAAVAGDVTNATLGHRTEIITTLTYTALNGTLPDVYFSATAADTIQLWGSVSVIPSAGTIDVIECYIAAEPLHLP